MKIFTVAAAALLLAGCGAASRTTGGTTSASPSPAIRGVSDIVTALAHRGIVDADECSLEKPTTPATEQERCQIGDGKEVTAMMFADAAGVDDRIGTFRAFDRLGKGKSHLVRGPTWLVNVGDLDPELWEPARSAVGGELVEVS
jgi:hypothetical protein